VAGRERDGSYPHYNDAVMASHLLRALPLLLLAAAGALSPAAESSFAFTVKAALR
jgi:hypothetical protein